jgi:dimethylargininase
MQLAVTRQVSPSIVDCELTYLTREPIDVARARRQHAQYEAALRDLGVAVLSLPEEPDLPDSVFVEDTALVLNECAIILRPGAASRRAESESIARILAPFRKLLHIQAPARVDGGDILRVRQHIYVGLTRRSDTNSIEQMQEMLVPFGYDVRPVQVTGCLHLKSAVTEAAQDVLLLNPNWVDRGAFEGVKIVEIDPSEPHAANVLRINETAIYDGAAFPRTRARLDLLGIRIVVLEADELAKAEGALTCCSLILSI